MECYAFNGGEVNRGKEVHWEEGQETDYLVGACVCVYVCVRESEGVQEVVTCDCTITAWAFLVCVEELQQ